MENSVKMLMIGFCVSLFAASISMIMYMYTQLDNLYNYSDNHIEARSILEESLIE